MKFFVAFMIGWLLPVLTISGIFLYTEWDSLAPSWDLVEVDDLVLIAVISILPGTLGCLFYAIWND